jgi:predicted peptidase
MSQAKKTFAKKITVRAACRYLLHLPPGYDQGGRAAGKRWPLILFLHGAGERGNDLELVKRHGIPKIAEARPGLPFIAVSPQCPAEGWWASAPLIALLDEIERRHRVDKDRIYATGISMGGFGTWQLALDQPRRFAAIAPICGRGNPLLAHRIRHLPVWAFHGAKDRVVPLSASADMVRALRKLGARPRFTIYPDAGHDSWTRTYENPRLYAWLLKHARQPR